jgi:hypothetical protein
MGSRRVATEIIMLSKYCIARTNPIVFVCVGRHMCREKGKEIRKAHYEKDMVRNSEMETGTFYRQEYVVMSCHVLSRTYPHNVANQCNVHENKEMVSF